jgi:hypothetical protein
VAAQLSLPDTELTFLGEVSEIDEKLILLASGDGTVQGFGYCAGIVVSNYYLPVVIEITAGPFAVIRLLAALTHGPIEFFEESWIGGNGTQRLPQSAARL